MGIRVLLCCFLLQNTDYKNSLLFTPFSATRFAMHRIYANRINSRGMSRVFCDLRSQKTPRGILPVNSNEKTPFYKMVFFFAFFLLRSNQFFKYLCCRHITQSIRISHTTGGPMETVYVIHICFTCDTQIIFAGCI